MVLGLQGYETLQRYGSAEAVGTLVALSLVRELGPVVAALLFASRAGSAMTAEIGLMKATEQISAMEMMAVDPIARVIGAALLGRRDLDAAAGRDVQRDGRVRRLPHRRCVMIGVDDGRVLVADAGRGGFRQDILNGVIKSVVFGVAVTAIALFEGYDAPPTAEGVSGATTRTVVTSSLAILGLDFVLTAFMFTGSDDGTRDMLDLWVGVFVVARHRARCWFSR